MPFILEPLPVQCQGDACACWDVLIGLVVVSGCRSLPCYDISDEQVTWPEVVSSFVEKMVLLINRMKMCDTYTFHLHAKMTLMASSHGAIRLCCG